MPGIFDNKIFNAEVFQGYVDRIPNTKRTQLIQSRAIRMRPDLAAAMKDQSGGNYISTTLRGLISGAVPQNYDGSTDIVPDSTLTFRHNRVVVGRMKAWTENDFSYDITGGQDFLENVAQQISEYWNEIDQDTLLHVLKGVFNMTGLDNLEFVDKHTLDICDQNNSESKLGQMDATTLNSGMQKACGDNKAKFSLVCMHSAPATNLENLKILTYLKYTDANGMERDIGLATLNGRLVLVDDGMPTRDIPATQAIAHVDGVKAKYTVTISAKAIAGDAITFTIGGVAKNYICGTTDGWAAGANVAADCTALAAILAQDYPGYTVTKTASTIVIEAKETGAETAATIYVNQNDTNGTLAGTIATTTTGVDEVEAVAARDAYTEYTTYVLGDGAIELTDCGAKVPYEVDRDPKTNGGRDTLFSRQRKCFAPYGISFTQSVMATTSPTDSELENGSNWELVNSMANGNRTYIDHKAIPIVRILSAG